MNHKLRTSIVLLVLCSAAGATTPSTSGSNKWWTYIAEYDGKPGSTRVDMGLRDEAPLTSLPTLVIFGVKYDRKPETEFPTDAALDKLNAESDGLIAAVLSVQVGIYVGTFTHSGEQLHYVYARSAEGTEAAFLQALTKNCPTCIPVYRTRADAAWNAYLKFLYPNQATLEHYGLDTRTFRSSR